MNASILQSCLDELDKPEPRIDFVRGVLKTLITLEGYVPPKVVAPLKPVELHTIFPADKKEESDKDEGHILDAKAKARLGAVKELADKSTELA